MSTPDTLTELIEGNRKVARRITYLEGEQNERSVSFANLYTRALGILYHLQKLGAQRGDHLILFLGDNEPFIDAFWGAMLGGIIPDQDVETLKQQGLDIVSGGPDSHPPPGISSFRFFAASPLPGWYRWILFWTPR